MHSTLGRSGEILKIMHAKVEEECPNEVFPGAADISGGGGGGAREGVYPLSYGGGGGGSPLENIDIQDRCRMILSLF